MERYAKGELELMNLVDVYEWEFDTQVPEEFPNTPFCPDMRQLYYNQGTEFLSNFEGYDGKKILEVESKFEYDIDDWVFNGIIDLVYEDENGKLVILDYKSKSGFKSKAEQAKYARQLYLYAEFIKMKYGKYPDLMKFYMFRKNNIIDIPVNKDKIEEATRWAKNIVSEIRNEKIFEPYCEEFYSENLCNHREYCDLRIY